MKAMSSQELLLEVIERSDEEESLKLSDRGRASEEIHGSGGDMAEVSTRYFKELVCREMLRHRV